MSKEANPYLPNAHGSAQTRKSVVAVLDVLGFSNKMHQAYKEGTDADLLRDLRSALTAAGEAFRGDYASTSNEFPASFGYREGVDPDGPDLAAIEAHRASVTLMLEEHKATPPIWAKYAWAANYHNFICDEQRGPLLELQIEPSLLRLTPSRLV